MAAASRRAATRFAVALAVAFAPATVAAPADSPAGIPRAASADDAGSALLAEAAPASYRRHLERDGVAVDLEIEALRGAATFREGDPVAVRFRVTDTHTGQPLSSLYPAAWMDRLPEVAEEQTDSCKQKVESFIGGSLLAQPELDLNVYYVLALNDDATISVVDPLFGFGNTKLLAMAFLEAPGYDWALTADQRWLFVSMPEAGKVAVVSTADWQVATNLEVGPNPGRLAIQPDGKYLWVAYRERLPGTPSESATSGVSAIDVERLRLAGQVPAGAGDHDLAFDDRGRHLFVTNRADGTVSVIDTDSLEVARTIATAADPVSIAHSSVGRAAFVSHGTSGVIVAIDGASLEVTARIEAEPGLGEIRFAPGGRLAFVVNPEADLIHILDAAAGRIIQTGDVEDGPDQVGFSDELAYVRHRGSEIILMIPLDEIGREGAPVPVVDFPGGQHPAGEMAARTPALGIVQAPGATAVLVANPLDRSIYFYKEGMAAPMGNFNNYSRQPRAVQVVDRSLREVEPGVYETTIALRRPGSYDLAFFLDAPRMVHCFDFQVAENPALAAERQRDREPLAVRYRLDDVNVTVGEEVAVRFELSDPVTGEPRPGLSDVEVLTFLAPGVWQARHLASERARMGAEAEGGLYEVRFTPPRAGVYYVFVQSQSQGLAFNYSPYVTLMATAAGDPGGAAGRSAQAEGAPGKEGIDRD
jgi:YVTN family beta-propeller protein